MCPASFKLSAQGGASDSSDKFTLSEAHVVSRRDNAQEAPRAQPGHGQASVKEQKDRREVRRMGRYPFLAWTKEYLNSVSGLYAKPTVKELDRRYRRMSKDFRALKANGTIISDNPELLTQEDIKKYIGLLKARGVKESGLCHNLGSLNNLLLFAGNPAIVQFKLNNPTLVPKRRTKRFDPISVADQAKILERAKQAKNWKEMKAYGLVTLCMSTGFRPKEVRLCNIEDIDTSTWRIKTIHVKGEDTYGQAREIPIDPKGRVIIKRYLAIRSEMITKHDPMNQALFPALRNKQGDGSMSQNSLTEMKHLVEQQTNTKFELRACRRTFGQNLIDQGASVETVSVLLGHNTTKTTETYYARKRQDAAILEVNSIWSQPNNAVNKLIETGKYLSGYA